MGRLRSQSQPSEEARETMELSQASSLNQTVTPAPGVITFTRCLLLNRMMTEEEVMATYLQVFTDDPLSRNFRNVLEEVNESLKESKIKIVSSKCELTDSKYYLVIPTYFRPTQIWPSLQFKENELSLIKTIISEIITSDVGLVTRERIVRKHKFMNSSDAKRVLDKLVEDNYLIEPRDEKYTLSALAMCELEPYFHFAYKDALKKCVFCKRIMFFGGLCQNCGSSGHFSCLTKFRESMKNQQSKCPSCNNKWSQTFEDILDHEDGLHNAGNEDD